MNRRLFATRIAKATGHAAATVAAILDGAIAVLSGELTKTGRFEWRGLGTFTVRAHAGRRIHNPATGQTITLQPRKTVAFKPSLKLKTKLDAPSDPRPRKLRRADLVRQAIQKTYSGTTT